MTIKLEWLNEAIEDAHTAILEDTNLPFDTVLARETEKIRARIIEEHCQALRMLRNEIDGLITAKAEGDR